MRLSLVGILAVALGSAVGCGKDKTGGGTDGGNSNDASALVDLAAAPADLGGPLVDQSAVADLMSATPIPFIHVRPTDQATGAGAPVYLPLVGIGVVIDATASSDPKGAALSFAWTVVSTPTGSVLDTAALTGPNTATPSFVPDVGGDYELELTLTTSDARTAKTNVTLTATTAPIFFDAAKLDETTNHGFVPTLMRSDGRGKHAVGCPVFEGENMGSSAPLYALSSWALAKVIEPALDPATGAIAPSRLVRAELALPKTDMNYGLEWAFSVLDEDSDCSAKPPRAVVQPHGPVLTAVWSPDATRVLYAQLSATSGDDITASYAIVNADAATPTATPITGLEALTLAPVEPAWVDDATISFVVVSNTTQPRTYQLYRAKLTGSVASDVTLWSDCSASSAAWGLLQGFEARGGVAYLGIGVRGPGGATIGHGSRGANIWRFEPGSTTTCDPVNLTMSSEGARDFAVSRDGTRLVYAQYEQTILVDIGMLAVPASDIWILETNNPASKRLLVGVAGSIENAPRFVAGGRQIVFYAGPPEAMLGPRPADATIASFEWSGISVINVDGSNPRALLGGSATVTGFQGGASAFDVPLLGANYSLLSMFGGTCAIDPLAHPLSSVATGLLVAAAIALGVRRRRGA